MNFFSRLTTVGKAAVIIIAVGIIGAVVYFSGATKSLSSGALDKLGGSSKGDYDLVLVTNTYVGFSPIVWGNGGLEPGENSPFQQKYGLRLKIIVMDDFQAARAALNDESAQVEYCTLDALPVEMSSTGSMADARYFMLLNFSAGADAIVADGSVSKVSDLKGKKVAYAEGTASHTLLINTLETAGMSMKDIVPVKVGSGLDAAQAFKAKSVNAAVCWSPDDADCVDAVKGAKVLTSTKQANNLVSDGLVAKKEWLENNKELAAKLVEAILYANSQVRNDEAAYKQAAESFGKAYETDAQFALTTQKNVNYATLQDELNWMGLNADFSGMTGERIYTKMARTYTELGLCKSVLPWSKVAYTGIVEAVAANNKLDNKQLATGTAQKQFSAPTAEMATESAVSTKKVTVNFPTAGYALDNDARATIDREFVDIVQTHGNQRVRISGNTDATGNYASNVELSKKRAQSVVDYLVREYKLDRNQFVVVGNGPKHAADDGVSGPNAAYRTTDIELIND